MAVVLMAEEERAPLLDEKWEKRIANVCAGWREDSEAARALRDFAPGAEVMALAVVDDAIRYAYTVGVDDGSAPLAWLAEPPTEPGYYARRVITRSIGIEGAPERARSCSRRTRRRGGRKVNDVVILTAVLVFGLVVLPVSAYGLRALCERRSRGR